MQPLSMLHGSVLSNQRCFAAPSAPKWPRHTRLSAQTVRCQASNASKGRKSRKTIKTRRGFGPGEVQKQQEPWEKDLLPSYRVYYKPDFKPSRFQGPIELKIFDDGSVGVVADQDVNGAELLFVSHPTAFLEGTLGTPPAVEDLHVALLEAQPGPAINKVLNFLPQKPMATAAVSPSVVLEPVPTPISHRPDTAAVAADSEQQQQQQVQQDQQVQQLQQQPGPQQKTPSTSPAATAASEVPSNLAQLVPMFWQQVGAFPGGQPLSSRQLMRMLQVSCWSEEVQDPAASQLRHEKPQGFIGVWTELAMLRHSCLPNTSCVVVDRFMLLHATEDVPRGGEITFNKLGSVIAAPLADRQAAHQELFGRPCCCSRCISEARLPADVSEAVADVHQKATEEWPARLQAALQAATSTDAEQEQTAEALTNLQAEVLGEITALEDELSQCLPDRTEQLTVLCAVYAAYDLAWQMEELLVEQPDLDKLANCVALLGLFARGSEGHVYTAMVLDQAYTARAQEMAAKAESMKRKTLATQRRMTLEIQRLLAGANAAAFTYAEAIACRYGMVPQDGLVPQLEQALGMFYAGLSALSAAQNDGLSEVPEVTRNLTIDGIPITVVDTVDSSAYSEGADGEMQELQATSTGEKLTIKMVEDQQLADVQRR